MYVLYPVVFKLARLPLTMLIAVELASSPESASAMADDMFFLRFLRVDFVPLVWSGVVVGLVVVAAGAVFWLMSINCSSWLYEVSCGDELRAVGRVRVDPDSVTARQAVS